jgi:hypothetical protein
VANQHLLNQALLKGQGLILLKGRVTPGLTSKGENYTLFSWPLFIQGETIKASITKGWEE